MNREAQTLIAEARSLLTRSLPQVTAPDIAEGIASYLVTGSIERHPPYSYRAEYFDYLAGSTLASIRYLLRSGFGEDVKIVADRIKFLKDRSDALREYIDKNEA
jgi:hypothetical protein